MKTLKIITPSATRGALFKKTAPLDPRQKFFIKGGLSLQQKRTFWQTTTAFGSFKANRLGKRLTASISFWYRHSRGLYRLQHFDTIAGNATHLTKTPGSQRDIIRPPCPGDF